MTPEQVGIALAIFGFIIWMIFWCVYGCFGPQYVRCACGEKCRISEDGWHYWKCPECKRSGKLRPL